MSNPLLKIGVVVALAVMLALTWVAGGEARFKTALVFAFGFLGGDALNVHQGPIDGCVLGSPDAPSFAFSAIFVFGAASICDAIDNRPQPSRKRRVPNPGATGAYCLGWISA